MTVTVLYDADCGVCRHTALTLRVLDRTRRLRFAPLQDFVPAAPGDPTPATLAEALHVRDEGGEWHAGGAAALEIARAIPALTPLALIGRLPGMALVAEAGYQLVARNRHALSRWLGVERCSFDPERSLGLPLSDAN